MRRGPEANTQTLPKEVLENSILLLSDGVKQNFFEMKEIEK
jgi:hypothetical protein